MSLQPASEEAVDFQNESQSGLVSIVIVCHHDLKLLKYLIPSIESQNYEKMETICVLNGRDDATYEYLSDHDVRVVLPDENLWYTGGANAGAAISHGEYIFVMNSDVVFDPNCIGHLIEYASDSPNAGVFIPKVLFKPEPNKIESIGMKFSIAGWYGRIGAGDPEHIHTEPCRVPAFDGAGFLIRRKAIEEAGLLDQRFDYYQESVDLSLRLLQTNWEIHTVPEAAIRHERGGSLENERSDTVLYYGTRNDLFLLGKHYNWLYLLMVLPIHVIWPVRRLSLFLLKGKISEGKYLAHGLIGGFVILTREIQSQTRLRIKEQYKIIFDLPKQSEKDT